MANILITAPSLNEADNVSGISTIVRSIIEYNLSHKYFHLVLGKKDKQKKSVLRMLQLMLVPFNTILLIIKYKIDIVHLNTGLERASVFRDFFVFIIAKYLLGKKVIFHIHGGYFLMAPPAKGSLFFCLINKMVTKSQKTIVLSKLEEQMIINTYNVRPEVLPNAITFTNTSNRSVIEFAGLLNFIFLGRIVASKGIFLIARALKRLKNHCSQFHFHIYGTGPDQDTFLKELAQIPGLQYTYHGIVRGGEKQEALNKAQVFLLPSIHSEGLPIALLEAMAAGCICIVSDDASMSLVVENDVTGIVVDKNNENRLYNSLNDLLNSRERLSAMSNNCSVLIKNKYNIPQFVQHLNKIYEKI